MTFNKLYISDALAAVCGNGTRGNGQFTRVEIVQVLWAYIKRHHLQDQANKRMINCDQKLRAIFGEPQISMFALSTAISKHIGTKPMKSTLMKNTGDGVYIGRFPNGDVRILKFLHHFNPGTVMTSDYFYPDVVQFDETILKTDWSAV